jgi:small subunit ribosomal protein S17
MPEAREGEAARRRRTTKVGVVVSTAMKDTVTVSVVVPTQHPKYKRIVRKTSKFMVHAPGNPCRSGDQVEIQECRPLSRRKRWRLVRVVQAGPRIEDEGRPSAGARS